MMEPFLNLFNGRNKAQLIVKMKENRNRPCKMIFNQVDDSLKITFHLKDGDKVKFGDVVFVVEGVLFLY